MYFCVIYTHTPRVVFHRHKIAKDEEKKARESGNKQKLHVIGRVLDIIVPPDTDRDPWVAELDIESSVAEALIKGGIHKAFSITSISRGGSTFTPDISLCHTPGRTGCFIIPDFKKGFVYPSQMSKDEASAAKTADTSDIDDHLKKEMEKRKKAAMARLQAEQKERDARGRFTQQQSQQRKRKSETTPDDEDESEFELDETGLKNLIDGLDDEKAVQVLGAIEQQAKKRRREGSKYKERLEKLENELSERSKHDQQLFQTAINDFLKNLKPDDPAVTTLQKQSSDFVRNNAEYARAFTDALITASADRELMMSQLQAARKEIDMLKQQQVPDELKDTEEEDTAAKTSDTTRSSSSVKGGDSLMRLSRMLRE